MIKPVGQESRASARNRAGVDFDGVKCSATTEDQNGLTAIAVNILLSRYGPGTAADTTFKFSNGSELVITSANFDAFYSDWTAFRQSFFE